MTERVRLFCNYLKNGGLYPCNVFTNLINECPEQLLTCIKSVDNGVSLGDRLLCNCYAESPIDCDCLPMPLLNHFVYIISSFGKHFDLAKQIMDALIERGCDVNQIDADIGTVLHSVICCIDNDIKLNATQREYNLSIECLDYLLSLNLCDLHLDVGYNKFCKARGTPLALAVERELISVVKKLIAVGVSVTNTTINRSLIPEVLNEKLVQIYDFLFEAGFHFHNDFNTNNNEVMTNTLVNDVVNHNKLRYSDWIQSKRCVPLNLKSLSRIAVRNSIKLRINDQNLMYCIPIPKSLLVYLKFETN